VLALRPEVGDPPGAVVSVDSTGVLVIDGKKVFPVNVSQPPPLRGKTADGQDAFKELASGGVKFVRVGRSNWDLANIDAQLDDAEKWLKAAADVGMKAWLWLGEQPVLSGPRSVILQGPWSQSIRLVCSSSTGKRSFPSTSSSRRRSEGRPSTDRTRSRSLPAAG